MWEQVWEFVQQPVVLAVIAVAVVVVLVSLCFAITPGRSPQASASPDPPPTDAAQEAVPTVSLASEARRESVLEYSVAVASFRTLDEAVVGQRELRDLEVPVYVAPTNVRDRVYYRLFAAMLPDRNEAEALMSRLVASGVKDSARDWDVRPTRLAFYFGIYPTQRSAEAEIQRLFGYGIPAYGVPTASSNGATAYHVYAGGYESPEEARHLQDQVERAGLDAELVERKGRALR